MDVIGSAVNTSTELGKEAVFSVADKVGVTMNDASGAIDSAKAFGSESVEKLTNMASGYGKPLDSMLTTGQDKINALGSGLVSDMKDVPADLRTGLAPTTEDAKDEPVPSDIPKSDCTADVNRGFLEIPDWQVDEQISLVYDTPPYPPILEPYDDDEEKLEKEPAELGIPFDIFNKKVASTAQEEISDNPFQNRAIESAIDLMMMDEFYEAIKKKLGGETFIVFMGLFNKSLKGDGKGGELKINYKGEDILCENAKYTLSIVKKGAVIRSKQQRSYPSSEDKEIDDSAPVHHVDIRNDVLLTDDFDIKIAVDIEVFVLSDAIALNSGYYNQDLNMQYMGLSYEEALTKAKAENLESTGKVYSQSVDKLAEDFLDIIFEHIKKNRSWDIARDVAFEVLDVALTIAAICTGTIAIKAAAKVAMTTATKAVQAGRVGLVGLEMNNMVRATDQLVVRRMFGVKGTAIDPFLGFSQFLDKKMGTGHALEITYFGFNCLMLLGKTPIQKSVSAVSSGSGASTMAYWLISKNTGQIENKEALEQQEVK
jgi:hypothetical protein